MNIDLTVKKARKTLNSFLNNVDQLFGLNEPDENEPLPVNEPVVGVHSRIVNFYGQKASIEQPQNHEKIHQAILSEQQINPNFVIEMMATKGDDRVKFMNDFYERKGLMGSPSTQKSVNPKRIF